MTLFLWPQKDNQMPSVVGIALCVYYNSILFIFIIVLTDRQTFPPSSPKEEEPCCLLKGSDKKQKWNDHSSKTSQTVGERV